MDVLPRYDEAVIPIEKFTKYALNPKNSPNKALVFREALGYGLDNAEDLVLNIRQNLKNFTAIYRGNKGYGDTYAVVMELTGANGRKANVMTAWIDDSDTGVIRLTSAYVKRKKGD